MTNLRPKLVIFDFDGTLIDSVFDLQPALNAMLAHVGRAPVSIDETRRMVGEGAARLVELALAARPGPDVGHAEALAYFIERYESAPAVHTRLYPGVRETLDTLQGWGIPLALCTNKPETSTRAVADALGLTDDFVRIVGGDTHAFRKPDPRMLTLMLEDLGVSAGQALLVGDSEVDGATALAAAVPFALVTYGYRKGPAEAIPADARLQRMEDLLTLIAAPVLTALEADD
jgi:phosphoglycolate phosphatase